MEIEAGDYIRTTKGTITKIEDIESEIKTNIFYKVFVEGNIYYEVIAKHSKNIIDLIEVGDYVNGYEVVPLYYDKDENIDILGVEVIDNGYGYIKELADINIRTILTHEMYEKKCYRLKE